MVPASLPSAILSSYTSTLLHNCLNWKSERATRVDYLISRVGDFRRERERQRISNMSHRRSRSNSRERSHSRSDRGYGRLERLKESFMCPNVCPFWVCRLTGLWAYMSVFSIDGLWPSPAVEPSKHLYLYNSYCDGARICSFAL